MSKGYQRDLVTRARIYSDEELLDVACALRYELSPVIQENGTYTEKEFERARSRIYAREHYRKSVDPKYKPTRMIKATDPATIARLHELITEC